MGAGGRAPYTLHTVTLNSLVRNPTLRSAFRVQCALEVLCYARTRRRNCSPGATIRTGSYPYSAPTAWLLRSERGSRRAGRYDAAFGVGARRARPIAQETGECRWVSLGSLISVRTVPLQGEANGAPPSQDGKKVSGKYTHRALDNHPGRPHAPSPWQSLRSTVRPSQGCFASVHTKGVSQEQSASALAFCVSGSVRTETIPERFPDRQLGSGRCGVISVAAQQPAEILLAVASR